MVTTPNYNLDIDSTLGGNNASDYVIPSQKAVKGYVDSQTGSAPTFANLTGSPYDNTNLADALDDKYDASNPDGYITGITSSDVTTALGYTPYNSTNPNGYQANKIETIKVNGTAQTITSKAVDISVPTNNNQLTNGAGYITSSALAPYALSADLATVATSGSYNDLSDKPTIPAAQVNSDWNASSGVAQILNKPNLATVATSGSYNDLSNKPTIPSEVTESTVSGWGFTKNTGTVTSVNNVNPVNGNVSLTIPDTSNLANKDLSNLSSTGNNKFQEPLVSGTNIKTVNGNSLLGSGDITIQSAPDIDNKSITTNASDKLQTVGVIDSNNSTNAIKTWTGTKAQYDAIATKDSNTLYNITDDTDVTLSLLELLYPVGAVYIGTMSVCPLQVLGVGTWQLVASDRVLQGAGTNTVGDLVEAGLPNIEGFLGFIGGGYAGYWGNGNGALSNNPNSGSNQLTGGSSSGTRKDIIFNASLSNSIYGNSTTVQPPAYIVNIWERIS